jgi:hypothetical protein
MIKLSNRCQEILNHYNLEFEKNPVGAQIRTAKFFNSTKQHINGIISRAKSSASTVSKKSDVVKYKLCRICDMELEKEYFAKDRKGVCIYCAELGINRCSSCGANYYGDIPECHTCRSKRFTSYVQKIKADPKCSKQYKKFRALQNNNSKKHYLKTKSKSNIIKN